MISRWPSPRWRWALRWWTAERLWIVTEDRRSWHNLGDLPIVEIYEIYLGVSGLGVETAMPPYSSSAPPSTISSGGTAAGVGHSRDGCSGGDPA
jgi:hypothetical protein